MAQAASISVAPFALGAAATPHLVSNSDGIVYSSDSAGNFVYPRAPKASLTISTVVTLPTTVTCSTDNDVALALAMGNNGIQINMGCDGPRPLFTIDDQFYSKKYNGQGPCPYGEACDVYPDPGDQVALSFTWSASALSVTWDDLTSAIVNRSGSDSSPNTDHEQPSAYGFGLLDTGYPLPAMSTVTMADDLVTGPSQPTQALGHAWHRERVDWGRKGAVAIATSALVERDSFTMVSS